MALSATLVLLLQLLKTAGRDAECGEAAAVHNRAVRKTAHKEEAYEVRMSGMWIYL